MLHRLPFLRRRAQMETSLLQSRIRSFHHRKTCKFCPAPFLIAIVSCCFRYSHNSKHGAYLQPQPPQHPRQRNAGVSVNFPPSVSDSSHKVFMKTPRGGRGEAAKEDASFTHQGTSKKGGEYVSPGIPPSNRGHQYQPYQQQQLPPQQFVEQQQRHPQERAPRREDVGGLQVAFARDFFNMVHIFQDSSSSYFCLQQPRSTLADINRHLPGHVHVNYSLTDGQQLVRDVAGRRRVMELMMRSSDQVNPLGPSPPFICVSELSLSR